MTSVASSKLDPWIDLTRVRYFAGTMVVFWPYAWGMTMAARAARLPLENFVSLMIVGFVGACVSHKTKTYAFFSCGCVWNDVVDRNIDQHVERTKNRPMAARKIPVYGALAFLGLHVAVLLSMIWHANSLAWIVGLATIFPLAGGYPFMKRITFWPQGWLGITINTGIVMGWACVTNTWPPSSWILSIGAWCWTIWYDTIYACQDKRDDVKAGVKSTALVFGTRVKGYLAFFGTCFMTALSISGALNHQSYFFYLFSILGGSVHLISQLRSLNPDVPKSCWKAFHSNGFNFGAIVELGLLLDYVSTIVSL